MSARPSKPSRRASPGGLPWWRRVQWRVPLLAALSGLLLALSMPGHAIPFAWPFIVVPLLFAVDEVLERSGLTGAGRAWRLFAATTVMGAVWAAITGGWMVNTIHVYGGVALPLAQAINVVGHALLVGTEFYFAVVVPFWLVRRRPIPAMLLVPFWAAALQAFWPHLFMWSFGQFMGQAPALVQPADLLGSAGLNLIYLPLEILLWAALRGTLRRPVMSPRELAGAGIAVLVLFAAAAGYGRWRIAEVERAGAAPATVRLIAIQPNFSLKRLASNPALSPSDREQSLGALLRDSENALQAAGPSPLPTVVIWPESVYPRPYFRDAPSRDLVERWVQARGIHLVLASTLIETSAAREEPDIYGVSVHVPPDSSPPAIYRKIFLMPWGEYIPFGDWFPWYRRLLLAWIPQIGEFQAGTEYTVFPINGAVRLAPMICYDATQVSIARGMAANGANLALVLANLAWFGPTTASLQFEQVIRFRAIENRLPLLFVSQNGRTLLFDAKGEPASPILPQFETGALTVEIAPANLRSVYTGWGTWIDRLYVLLAVGLAGTALWRKRRES